MDESEYIKVIEQMLSALEGSAKSAMASKKSVGEKAEALRMALFFATDQLNRVELAWRMQYGEPWAGYFDN